MQDLAFFQKTFGFLGSEGDIQSDEKVNETNLLVPYENKYTAYLNRVNNF